MLTALLVTIPEAVTATVPVPPQLLPANAQASIAEERLESSTAGALSYGELLSGFIARQGEVFTAFSFLRPPCTSESDLVIGDQQDPPYIRLVSKNFVMNLCREGATPVAPTD